MYLSCSSNKRLPLFIFFKKNNGAKKVCEIATIAFLIVSVTLLESRALSEFRTQKKNSTCLMFVK